jgi:hypothetical protein
MCHSIGADRTIDVLIATGMPSTPTEFTACLRGPGWRRREECRALLVHEVRLAVTRGLSNEGHGPDLNWSGLEAAQLKEWTRTAGIHRRDVSSDRRVRTARN